MTAPRLSLTWRARLLNGTLSALALVALVSLAQNRIRTVLYGAVDEAVRAQAEDTIKRPPPFLRMEGVERRMGRREGFGFFPLFGGGGGGGRGPFGGRGGDMPPLRFGTTSLLPPRRIALDGRTEPERPPWSRLGFTQVRKPWDTDLREERSPDGKRLRVFTIRTQNEVLQTAADLEQTDAALAEIQRALYALILPVGLLMAILGALLTDLAFAPIRRLARAAAALQPNDLSQRLPQPGGGDTFDQLVLVLNAMLMRLESAFVRQRRFTADASHELRTPLAVIKAATSFLLEGDDPLSERQRRTLSRADRTVDRANTLVSDLLLLARSENGSLTVQTEPVALPELLTEAARTAEAGQATPHAAVTIVATEQTLLTDPKLLHRLVVNLVSNALRHTPTEGTITVEAQADGSALRLRVSDTGEGIAPEHLERLGEPFYRPDASRAREQGGVGLGLALCKEIAATLGGKLTIESQLGHGTTVQIELPTVRP